MAKTSAEIRRAFLEFFANQDHQVVPSGPVIAPNDPTLMFAAAGMVQFKDVFTGAEQRGYRRATSSQKCIRISGKHNDLENVGPSPRHHTFFEMLGNFSFGDYFKEEAIVYAWDFLKELDLPKDRLCITYFKGEDGVPADTEAVELWKKVSGLSDDRIIGCGKDENFWSAGDTGPCGPCSEIHYYHGPNPDPSTFEDGQTPEGFGWMEIWNLVFMQFERGEDGVLSALPAPSIDTGMGLERITGVVQGKTSNYDTDLLLALVDRAAEIADKPYRGSMSADDVSMRVIADHSRLTAFLLAEGVMPDKNAREYVLRRVMRRAIRHGHRLGISKPFLHDMTQEVVRLMGEQYPELNDRSEHMQTVAEQEEVRFRRTIERGLSLINETFDGLTAKQRKTLTGKRAFELYDTYGFPLDLTQVICKERGFDVDEGGYHEALREAQERSSFKGLEAAVGPVYRAALETVPGGEVRFTGYDSDAEDAQLLAIISGGQLVTELTADSASVVDVALVFDQTPFYGESGGQVGDTGEVRSQGVTFKVTDTQKPIGGLVVHEGQLVQGQLTVGKTLRLSVHSERREAIRRNHSATHLVHWALREVLGSHVQQKGSRVEPERLRFDFTQFDPVTKEQLRAVEDLVNLRIVRNAVVETETLSISAAKDKGATMLFGEKYGDEVRVLSMAESIELCGGTHVKATGEIGLLKVVGEQGVAAGVRRVVATTGTGVVQYLRETEDRLAQVATAAKATGGDVVAKVEKLVANDKLLEKKLADMQKKLLAGGGSGLDGLLAQARDIDGVKVLAVRTEVTDRGALRELAEQLRDKLGDAAILVASEHEGKAQLVVTVAKPICSRLKAGQLIKPVAAVVGGSGGGRPDMAQAGGTDAHQLDAALECFYRVVSET